MRDLTTGNESRLIFRFAVPMLLGNIFQQLYNVVDSAIVGRFLGKEALASVGASFPIIFALIALIIGIGTGFGIVISQYYGAKDLEKVKRTISTMFISLGLVSLVMTILGIALSKPVFRLLQLPPDLLPQAVLYMNIYLIGIVAMFGFNGTSAVLRGLGDSKTPLVFLIISTVINIGLDLLFILVFGWGIAGAAWATVISQAGAFITAVIYLNKNHDIISFNLKEWKFDWEIMRHGIRIGLPSGLQQTFVAFGMMALMGIVNTFGTDVIAAYSVGGRIDSFASLPAMAFSAALATFTGQNLGAGKDERIKKGLVATTLMASVFCIFTTTLIIIFREPLVGLFNQDPEVIRIGSEYLTIVNIFYILFTLMFIMYGVVRGAGATLVPMFISVLSLWLIRIPVAAILSKSMGEAGIWWSIPIAWAIGFIGAFAYYLSGKWKGKVITRLKPLED
ncbi:MAG TPA: MATE family efflux transporter [Marinilabiliales bacterium]|nr:MAG: MATE family efflux transporter [Bacteroidetes bacterium GWA2_40_14]OFX75440.1 MAG: MATE family efflux transporter [Bacteroidetes bacterium GWD2_40_43]OFX93955.1 MAG: MATE family efflux transporter [Bacteroidetes bacterium GWE2_40_63]OFY19744.1 MAG: MATE family efflux transporter [Bacteroidetes bacterium GWF2_40_13]OFZ24536.1 MAG: MATE family efflux transporter [Bacteroidetes bacterium RIFOXYC2_FULL_40_12]HAN00118.1 MATE family efflux transporter [Marinilabiliales bacterium]